MADAAFIGIARPCGFSFFFSESTISHGAKFLVVCRACLDEITILPRKSKAACISQANAGVAFKRLYTPVASAEIEILP